MSPLPFLADLFDALPLGIVLLDRDGRVVHFNRTEERLARRSKERALGRDFFLEVAPCMDVQQLAGVFRDGIGRRPLFERLDISFAFPFLEGPRDVSVYLRSLEIGREPYGCLIIEDTSAQRAAERMQRSLDELLRPDAGSPIAGILANCGYLLDQLPGLEGPALETVGDIAYSADDLQDLLMNLLDISRLESKQVEVRVSRHDLVPMVHSAADTLREHAERRGVVLAVQAGPGPLEAMVDAPLMMRVLDSLLLNALRHSPAQAAIRVLALRTGDGHPCIEVRDQGPPLPHSVLPTVEHRYFQGEAPGGADEHRDPDGLTIRFVQIACAAHGGQLTVTSDAERGTTYRIRLPAPVAATPFLGG